MTAGNFRSGLIALIGRPNVGKSTLLNRLVGANLSITSRRPQTTRHRLLGIKTTTQAQVVYVDTPGMIPPTTQGLSRHLSRIARASVEGVDVVGLLISATGWHAEDDRALAVAKQAAAPVILIVNKIDRLKSRDRLLPLLQTSGARMTFAEIIPLSALTGTNVDDFEHTIYKYLPEQPPIYPPTQRTDRGEAFLAAEQVREQVFSSFGQEIPYATTVTIERFKRLRDLIHVEATIWVEKEGQKGILIGKEGMRLKMVGRRARLAMQDLFGTKVHVELWVKVRSNWSSNAKALRSLGYHED